MSDTQQILRDVVSGLIDQPDQLQVNEKRRRGKLTLEVRVAGDDMGAVIGREGRTAEALRTILGARSEVSGEDYDLRIRPRGGRG